MKSSEDAVAVIAVQGEAMLDWTNIEKWRTLHGTMEILAQAKAEASSAWDDSVG